MSSLTHSLQVFLQQPQHSPPTTFIFSCRLTPNHLCIQNKIISIKQSHGQALFESSSRPNFDTMSRRPHLWKQPFLSCIYFSYQIGERIKFERIAQFCQYHLNQPYSVRERPRRYGRDYLGTNRRGEICDGWGQLGSYLVGCQGSRVTDAARRSTTTHHAPADPHSSMDHEPRSAPSTSTPTQGGHSSCQGSYRSHLCNCFHVENMENLKNRGINRGDEENIGMGCEGWGRFCRVG